MRQIATIDCHVAGQPLRLIVGGLPGIAGRTMAERLAFAERRLDGVRRAVMLEPRGHRDMTGAILTESGTPGASAGLIFLDADGWRGLCGHGLIGALTIAVERRLLVTPPDVAMTIDTASGPIAARVETVSSRGGPEAPPSGETRVRAVTFTAPPAIVVAPGVQVAAGNRRVSADLARCGGLFAIVDAEHAGLGLTSRTWARLRALAIEILERLAAAERPAEGVIFTGPADSDADLRAVTVYAGGSLDRSPSGIGLAALTAVLDAMGLMSEDRELSVEGATGLRMTARLVERFEEDGHAAVRADITGSAWITGEHTFFVESDDPLAEGWQH